jgi:hypothetical protein
VTVELERMSVRASPGRRAWLARTLQRAALLLVVVLGLGLARTAHATAQDERLEAAVSTAMSDDYPQNLGQARSRITTELERCKGGRCTGAMRAKAYAALGVIAGQNGQGEEAKVNFRAALDASPDASLPSVGMTAETKALWESIRGVQAPAPALDVSGAQSIPGWNSLDAFKAAAAGLAADQAGNLPLCIERDRASLLLEEQPRTRLHLSSCERRSNKYVDALKDAQKALETGLQKRDLSVMKVARSKVEDLLKQIPHVTFVPPTDAENLEVKFDERDVPEKALEKRFSVDPGPHAVHAEGVVGGVPTTYDEEFDVKPGELLTVRIHLNAPRPEFITKGQLRCTLAAKNQEEVDKCFPKNAKNIVVKMGVETAGYGDSDHVYVFTPSINASISSPTAGWNVGGTYVLDVLSAASPDIVSEASNRYKETRSAGTLTGGYKPGLYGFQAQANFSREPDYFSRGAGLALTGDFKEKTITPRLAFNYSLDTIGRRSLDVDTTLLKTAEMELGTTFVLSPTSLVLVSLTGQFERGDQSKPYRYIPVFDPSIAPHVPSGAVVDLVNRYRLPFRPNEQLPTERDRYALGARFAHRFTGINSTFRAEERVYIDDWGLKSTTTDLRFVVDAGKRLRLWPHFRYNVQNGVNFYQLAYSATTNAAGQLQVPLFRTGDRELSPMDTITGGGGVRYALSAPDSKVQWDLTLQGDVMYSQFFDSLYVTMRTALYGSLALDVEFE